MRTTILAFLLLVTSQQWLSASAATFSDISASYPYFDAIVWAQQEGIVHGYPDGTFRPDNTINRAEMTKILLLQTYDQNTIETEQFSDTHSFTDVPENSWFYRYILFAWQKYIISGYLDNTFRPETPINFAEASKILVLSQQMSYLRDMGTMWYESYIDALQRNSALPKTYRKPDQLVTRGEMVQMIFLLSQSN